MIAGAVIFWRRQSFRQHLRVVSGYVLGPVMDSASRAGARLLASRLTLPWQTKTARGKSIGCLEPPIDKREKRKARGLLKSKRPRHFDFYAPSNAGRAPPRPWLTPHKRRPAVAGFSSQNALDILTFVMKSALGELVAATRLVAAVFLALDDTGVAGEEAAGPEDPA